MESKGVSPIVKMVISEAECWCVLHEEDIENLEEDTLIQCITEVASALGLTEEDVENILNEYLEI